MKRLSFVVQGSSSRYQTTFEFDGNNIRAFCTCLAGENGQICKHRTEILSGDYSAIIGDKSQIVNLLQIFKGSILDLKIQELKEAEKQELFFKNKVASTKKEIAKIMIGK